MEPIKLSYTVAPGNMSAAGHASSEMKMTLRKLGMPADIIRKASICMYEGEINMVIHANGGVAEVIISLDDITIRLTDTGPGIPDVELAMQAGWSTAPANIRNLGFGAGMGLPNIKEYSDELTIETEVGVGTTLTAVIHAERRD